MRSSSSWQKAALSSADVGVLLILTGAVCSGLRPLFGRWLSGDDVAVVIIAIYNFVLGVLLFLPGGVREIKRIPGRRAASAVAFCGGLIVGLSTMAYFEALKRLPVATVTLIYFTYPAMVVAIVALLRRRWPQPTALLAVACVLVGCGVIIGPDLQGAGGTMVDYAIAFVGPLSWTLLLLLLAGPLAVLSPWSRIGFIDAGATLAMVVVMLIWQPSKLAPATLPGWLGVLGLVVVSGLLTHVLYTLGVPRAGSERASIAGVFEVATALVVGWVVFLEPMALNQWGGLALIGAALLFTRRLEVVG